MRIVLLLLFTLTLKAWIIEAFLVENYVKSMDNRYSYKISANSYLNNIEEIKDKYRYFNREKILKEYRYFKDGYLEFKGQRFDFKKSFRVGNSLILIDTTFSNKTKKSSSKKCKIDINRAILKCKHIKFYENGLLKGTKIGYKKRL